MRISHAIATVGAVALLLGACSSHGTVSSVSSTSPASSAHDLTFTSGPDTIHATFQPAQGTAHPGVAVLIISGSGSTDRNGDQGKAVLGDTNQRFAAALAAEGVSSLRYDKLGSGQTGLGSHTNGQGITFDLYLDEALDAYKTLAAQPGVDPSKLIVLGHSEGGLFALLIAGKTTGMVTAPHALILASTVGIRFLDLLGGQTVAAYQAQEAAKTITPAEEANLVQQMNTAFASIRAGQPVTTPMDDKGLAAILTPTSVQYLYQEDQQDPAALARGLGNLPVLVLHGTKDTEVTDQFVAPLLTALQGDSAVIHDEVPDANHLYQRITGTPNPATDYADASLPFAPEVEPDLKAFLQKAF